MGEEQPEKVTPGTAVLRLRGLPFQATEEDIKEFFSSFSLKQIYICRRGGRATGEAYVQASSPTSASEALKALNRKHMGRRYIEIFEASESDLNAVKALSGENKIKGFVVRMRGLPYSATEADVTQFFTTLEITKGGIIFTYTPDGRPTGEAYVEFPTEDLQKEAMKRHKELIGPRYIELFLSTRADMYQAMQQTRFNLSQASMARRRWFQQGGINVPGVLPDATGLRLPGVPYSGVEEVTEYFSGFNLGPRAQLLTRPESGNVLPGGGLAFVQYDGSEEAQQAARQKAAPGAGARYGDSSLLGAQGRGPYADLQNPQNAPSTQLFPQNVNTYRQGPVNQLRGPGSQAPVGVPAQLQPGMQQIMTPPDYQAQQQQALMMQQHYLIQQQMLQQQPGMQGIRYDAPWGAVGSLAMPPQANPQNAWFKPSTYPGGASGVWVSGGVAAGAYGSPVGGYAGSAPPFSAGLGYKDGQAQDHSAAALDVSSGEGHVVPGQVDAAGTAAGNDF